MMHYEIPTVLNLNGYANQVDLGNFQPDDVMPGIPGNFGYYDGIAAEIVTFIEFPEEGLITMGVNSDDGFQLTMGAIGDKANATVAAKAAGVSDTKFIVDVREAGITARPAMQALSFTPKMKLVKKCWSMPTVV